MAVRFITAGLLATIFVAALAAVPKGAAPSALPKDTLPETLPTDPPLGLDKLKAPADNPLTAERIRLGRRLFFDPILSGDRTVACASCHQPEHGFASAEALPRGVGGKQLRRRAPTLFNRAYGTSQFWDGRSATLEEQALKPIENPDEMGARLDDVIARLKAHADYPRLFSAAFDDGMTTGNLAKAIASFERVILRGSSRVDLLQQKGEHKALSPSERAGLWLYESKGRCWKCHVGANYTDDRFHNTGIGWGGSDLGRFEVTKSDADRGKFKTPTLRGVGLTAPYMHDGSLKTLEEVVEFYNKGGHANPHLDPSMTPLKLTKEEIADLVAFLKAL